MSSVDQRRPIPWGSQSADGQVLLSMPWELFVYGAAALSIVNLVLAVLFRDPSLEQVVFILDVILISTFAIDLVRRLQVADDNRAYLIHGQGWLDVISIIPALRIARILRVVRTTRILQGMGGVGPALRVYFANPAAGGLLAVLFIAVLVLEFGSMGVLWAEQGAADANIVNAHDAVWYTLVTMSTVGYGDQFPVTGLGRVIGILIIIVGVGVFGTLTGFLANAFVSPSRGVPTSAHVATAADAVESPPDASVSHEGPGQVLASTGTGAASLASRRSSCTSKTVCSGSRRPVRNHARMAPAMPTTPLATNAATTPSR